MEVLLALLALLAAWIVYGHVSRLRDEVRKIRDELLNLKSQLKSGELKQAPVEKPPSWVTPRPVDAAKPEPVRPPEPPPPRPVVVEQPKPAAPPPLPPKPFTLPQPEPVAARQAPPPKPPAPKKPAIAWEQQLGARLPVWIGGIALALSGIFLVIYSIEQGYLSPLVRVIMAGVFGALMLIAAQIILARGKVANGDRIAQALSGAGIAVLYGALFSASTVYGFISSPLAFAAMAAVTALAVVLSLRQGPPTAILGMIGGFLTPALVGGGEPNAPVLFGYLIALTVGLFVVIRSQNWWWLAWPTLGAAYAWLILWLLGPSVPGEGLWLGLFLVLLSSTAFSFIAPAEGKTSPPFAWLGLLLTAGAAVVFMAIVLNRTDFGVTEWGFYVLITLGTIALAWRNQEQYRLLPWLTLGMSLVLLGVWQTGDTEFFAFMLVALAAIFAVSGIVFLWRAKEPIEWTRLACVSSLAFYGIALAKLSDIVKLVSMMNGIPIWGVAATFLAVVMTLVTGRIAERFGTKNTHAQALLAHMSLTAIAFLSLGFVLELPPDYLPVAAAGAMFAVAWISARTDINVLRPAAAVLAFLFLIALLPQAGYVIQYAVTATMGEALTVKSPALVLAPLFHLGIPAAFFALSSFELRRKADDTTVHAFEVSAATLVGIMGYFLIRHAQTPAAEIMASLGSTFDGAIITDALLMFAIALVAIGRYFNRATLAVCGLTAAVIGLARVIHFDVQPLQLLDVWMPMALGQASSKSLTLPIAVSPLFYLGVPAVLVLALRLLLGRTRDEVAARVLEYVPIALIGLMGYFLIRHAFNPLEQVLTGMGSRFEGGIISQSQIVYALALMWAATFFKRDSLVNAAVIAASIALLRIVSFDVAPVGVMAYTLSGIAGATLDAGRTIPIAAAPIFHLALPAVLFALLSMTLRGVRERIAEIMEYVAIAFAGLMTYFLIRHAFNGAEQAFSAPGTFLERGVITNALLLFGVGLFALGRYANRRTLFVSGVVVALLAVARIFYFDLLTSSPLVAAHDVGTWPIVNALLLAYGLPVLWLGLAARALEQRKRMELVPYAKGAALLFLFVWISLNVRQFFQGPFLDAPGVGSNEVYAYSVAWLLLGIGLLIVGAAWKDKVIRFASLAVMILTVGKVFLYDASELTGLLRVFSFAGLGASLMGLSWFYTRYVFERDPPKEGAGTSI
ncbi:MAG: DUF2339 domain-containing protein [Alphaproteobacteria bacterium]|nr:DUF2339 domain-containing protein [Alphaproteobacteria bacterium]